MFLPYLSGLMHQPNERLSVYSRVQTRLRRKTCAIVPSSRELASRSYHLPSSFPHYIGSLILTPHVLSYRWRPTPRRPSARPSPFLYYPGIPPPSHRTSPIDWRQPDDRSTSHSLPTLVAPWMASSDSASITPASGKTQNTAPFFALETQ